MTEIQASLVDDETIPRNATFGIVNGAVFLGILALGGLVYLTPLKAWLTEGQLIKEQLGQFGLAAPLVFTVAAAALTAIGIPRLLLCSLAAMAFGFSLGLMWSEIATVLGSYITFLFVRWRGRDYVLRQFPRIRRFSDRLQDQGLWSVLFIRQLPINGFYNNVLLGLMPVTHGEFIFGSLLGFLPLGITACLLGAGILQGDIYKSVQYIALAMICSVGLALVIKRTIPVRR